MFPRAPGHPEGLNCVTQNVPASYRVPVVTQKVLSCYSQRVSAVTHKASTATYQVGLSCWQCLRCYSQDSSLPKGSQLCYLKGVSFIQSVSAVTKTSGGTKASDVLTERVPAVTQRVSGVTHNAPAVTPKVLYTGVSRRTVAATPNGSQVFAQRVSVVT